MQGASLVMQFLARLAHTLLTGAQTTEVFSRLGNDIRAELFLTVGERAVLQTRCVPCPFHQH